METTIAFGISNKPIALFIILPTICKIFFATFSKIIIVNKIVTRIIRWVNINHFNFAKIGFLQKFKYVKIVAFNIKVFGIIKINAFFFARTERCRYRRISKKDRFFLIWPSELIAFFLIVNKNATHFLL